MERDTDEAVIRGEFGPVRVVEGGHRGRVGYYDDDDEEGIAIVYFEDPMKHPMPPYFLIDLRWLRRANALPW